MKPKTTPEKIEFMAQKWLDEAQLETILEYAAEKLEEFYGKLDEKVVNNMYEDALESRGWFSPGFRPTRMGLDVDGFDTYQGP